MEIVSLKAADRVASKSSNNAIRREGFLPVILYGRGTESRPLKISTRDFERILTSRAGRNSIIRLEIEGEPKKDQPTVLIRDVQSDPVRTRYLHADLMRISLEEEITARVPIYVTGEEAAAREGGIVQQQLRETEVECLPTALPDHITVDLTGKGIGDTVTAGDLEIPEGVRILDEPGTVVVTIVAPKMVVEEEEEEEEAEAAAVEGEEAPEAEGEAPPSAED